MKLGLDIGSTTLKCVVLSKTGEIIYKSYQRHYSDVIGKTLEVLEELRDKFGLTEIGLHISGSAGMGIAEICGIGFIQEVYATRCAVRHYHEEIDTVIELGGEDAKILFLRDASGGENLEVRMNGSCAGGTGAFIDQMATLLGITPDQLNSLAQESEKIYTIASRCGVFAKSDIQPLLNQGARREDIAASIFYAVVNQTVAGLAQGRKIGGNVLYLGGPATYFSQLRAAFDKSLKITGICPENSLYYVALGAALSPGGEILSYDDVTEKIKNYTLVSKYTSCRPLFTSQKEYDAFIARHAAASVPVGTAYDPQKEYYLGVDAGSTTVKAVIIDRDCTILKTHYVPNSGNPVPLIKNFLINIYEEFPGIKFAGSASTGYGEELIKAAFTADGGIVETMAHFYAARHFSPEVDFIIDIGGQDIKCFKIRNKTIDNIFLNEACSSGCGSFLQTFAGALGYNIRGFAKLGLFAENPADLGSRCTVFMNSAVKQAQKDGAAIESISAGLSISVVKNALYKVIRCTGAGDLGKNIVVQGGTFLNDAVLRAFEQEIGGEVIRPDIAGLMGAFGAALYAMKNSCGASNLISYQALKEFTHEVRAVTCNGCSNACKLTVNRFGGGRQYLGGNRCDKPLNNEKNDDSLNMFAVKTDLLAKYKSFSTEKPSVGLAMGLNMFELLPFWHTFFKGLGYGVTVSPPSNRKLYLKGQYTIPSDTVCFPAKLLHGHIEELIEAKTPVIFSPCMTFNFNESTGDNHFNCPVVAYYSEVLKANIPALDSINFIYDHINLHNRKLFPKTIHKILTGKLSERLTLKEITAAADAAYAEYESFMESVRLEGERIMSTALAQNKPVIVIAGRPYHLDPEVNHGIDRLILSLGAAIVTDDSIYKKNKKVATNILNQWTYHSRMFSAGEIIAAQKNSRVNVVQLVSFGCGLDAVTTDELRDISENLGGTYTQIKIDEITNLGAVRIRIRSLLESAAARKPEAVHGKS